MKSLVEALLIQKIILKTISNNNRNIVYFSSELNPRVITNVLLIEMELLLMMSDTCKILMI